MQQPFSLRSAIATSLSFLDDGGWLCRRCDPAETLRRNAGRAVSPLPGAMDVLPEMVSNTGSLYECLMDSDSDTSELF